VAGSMKKDIRSRPTGWLSMGRPLTGMIRLVGVTGTRGYRLAALNIALTVLAAPIDDLASYVRARCDTLEPTPSSRPSWRPSQRRCVPADRLRGLPRRAAERGLAALVLAGAFVYGASPSGSASDPHRLRADG